MSLIAEKKQNKIDEFSRSLERSIQELTAKHEKIRETISKLP
jgi:prefoldin subunit 5